MVGAIAGALLSAAGLLSSFAEAQVAETTSPNYINASDPDNSPVHLNVNLRNKAARNKTSP
jgi:hypothetical protein